MLNVITHTSVSRNFFTDLRKTSVDMRKPRFASSIRQSANDFFLHFLVKKKKLGEGTSIRRSKVTLLFSLTCSVDFFMPRPYRPYNKPAFLALIPPSFKSLNPFVAFSRLLQPHFSSHNWGKYENSRFNSCRRFQLYIENAVTRNKPCTRNQVDSE